MSKSNVVIENAGLKEARKRIKHFSDSWDTELDLSDLGLEQFPVDLIEEEAPDLIRTLNLSRNRIEELPASIGRFTGLETLDLGNNRLSKLPESFIELVSLKKLKLNDNDLVELPENIDKIALLETLDVSRNRLTRLPETIKNLRSLKRLDFNWNKLSEVPSAIKKFTARQKLTILTHIRKLADMTAENALSEAFFERAKAHIKVIMEKFHLSPEQAVIYAQFLMRFDDQSIYIREIASALDLSNLEILPYLDEFNELEKKKLLFCRRTGEGELNTYRVPAEVIEALVHDKPYVIETYVGVSIEKFFEVVDRLFNQHGNNELTYEVFVSELNALIDNNMHLTFSKKLREAALETVDMVLLFRFCHRLIFCNDDSIGISDIGGIFSDAVFRDITRAFSDGDHELVTRGIIERKNDNEHEDDFFGDSEYYALTAATKADLLSELRIKQRKSTGRKDALIIASGITVKQLFYNKKEEGRVQELADLLNDANFKAVQQRLIEKGLREGFACLFSGAPGTGKTETVYQLARQSGRDLMPVNIADIQSKWVGESEKNLDTVFKAYQEAVKNRERAPILLFNEADGLISKRLELGNSSRSVDQMMNSLQNIILEKMEKLSGILIATTNLSQNMDKAFERRFLYKIEFEKPGTAVRQAIWQSLLPALSADDAKALAIRFDFSGGQIENVTRRAIADYVISGKKSSFDQLVLFCKDEAMAKPSDKPLGFKRD
jgi:SpoVK/Ycf46/Vps4 family AAA+-type ATPase